MKIGEWDNLGRARAVVQRNLGELGAAEYAAHVTLNQENGRIRIYLATDIGLLEYSYASAGADPEGAWLLRGQVYRWSSVRGLRLQSDAQIDDDTGEIVWRLVAEDPKLDLSADSMGWTTTQWARCWPSREPACSTPARPAPDPPAGSVPRDEVDRPNGWRRFRQAAGA